MNFSLATSKSSSKYLKCYTLEESQTVIQNNSIIDFVQSVKMKTANQNLYRTTRLIWNNQKWTKVLFNNTGFIS